MNNELYHYGVLGMKWGVRRYQNADGTRTEAGKKRYSSKVDDGPHYNVNARDVRKNMDRMTDVELRQAINRINMQQDIARLNPTLSEKGRRAAMQITKDIGMAIGLSVALKKLPGLYGDISYAGAFASQWLKELKDMLL